MAKEKELPKITNHPDLTNEIKAEMIVDLKTGQKVVKPPTYTPGKFLLDDTGLDSGREFTFPLPTLISPSPESRAITIARLKMQIKKVIASPSQNMPYVTGMLYGEHLPSDIEIKCMKCPGMVGMNKINDIINHGVFSHSKDTRTILFELMQILDKLPQ